MQRAFVCGLLVVVILLPLSAGASTIDLGHPSAMPFTTFTICFSVPCDRSVVFDAVSSFSISSAGIKFDPLNGGPTSIFVDIYSSNLNASFSNSSATHGALLATASTSITDVGLAFYNIPISFTFISGNRYDLAFRGNLATSWGLGPTDMELYFYNLDQPSGPYLAGPVSVVDGACHASDCGNYVNGAMPHVQFETVTTTVPEPSSLLLLGSSLAAFVSLARWGRSSSSYRPQV